MRRGPDGGAGLRTVECGAGRTAERGCVLRRAGESGAGERRAPYDGDAAKRARCGAARAKGSRRPALLARPSQQIKMLIYLIVEADHRRMQSHRHYTVDLGANVTR